MRQWIAEARELEPTLKRLREELRELESEASPRARSTTVPPFDSRFRLAASLERHRKAHRDSQSGLIEGERVTADQLDAHLAQLDREIEELQAELTPNLSVELPEKGRLTSRERTWRLDQLRQLVENFADLLEGPMGLPNPALAMSATRSWSSPTSIFGTTLKEVENRYALSERAYEVCRNPKHASVWREIEKEFLRDDGRPAFAVPIPGLVPLDKNPMTGFWEFWHVASGDEPKAVAPGDPSASNRWTLDSTTGMVFVLLPGGRALCGSQRDPSKPHFEPDASRQSPLHHISLDPFLISKYEMTRGQWWSSTGHDPSAQLSDRGYAARVLPLENVSRGECLWVLERLGLTLPTEAQWEYACRGGSPTQWWTGDRSEALRTAANLRDRSWEGTRTQSFEPWDDGHLHGAPVGALDANQFGLHDVIGNVAEWCLDDFGPYQKAMREGHGLRIWPAEDRPVFRGGGSRSLASEARSSTRSWANSRLITSPFIGVRPALKL